MSNNLKPIKLVERTDGGALEGLTPTQLMHIGELAMHDGTEL